MQTPLIPDISVNIAVFNTQPFLAESINSILSQSFHNFELIIVDDGSTDGSLDILEKFARQDPRIKLLKQANGGVGAARNLALKNSKGRYIAVMDSDDIALPERFALQKDFLDAHAEIDAVGSQWSMIKPNGEEVGIDTHATDPLVIQALMYDYYALHHPTTMIRRESMEAVGGYSEEAGRLCVDYDLFMRMQARGCKFSNLPFVLFKWRLNPDGITHGKARRQTEFVIKTRHEGFAHLLQNDPAKAQSIAYKIVYSFPTGTWQDRKINQLFPGHEGSLLFQTWLSLPCNSAEEALNRALVLWLRAPEKNVQTLHDQLTSNGWPWLASLLNAYHGLAKKSPAPRLTLPEPSANANPLISLFIPFTGFTDDFSQRLGQAIDLQKKSGLAMELIVFSAATDVFKPSLISLPDNRPDCIVIEGARAWEDALAKARGSHFAYLEENFRFKADAFLQTLVQFVNGNTDILYLLADRYFTEALDNKGMPLPDDSPVPAWTRSTLFGKDRVQLTGFIHHRTLLGGFQGHLKECGPAAGRILARHLAVRNSFDIATGAVSYFIPGTHLEGRPLPVFQQTILDWYYDYGMTALPASAHWPSLSEPAIEHYARELSDAWQNNRLVIHPGNEAALKQFYLQQVAFPMRWPLFRHLLLHNKKSFLITLWHNKAFLNAFSAFGYCSLNVLRNRSQALFNQ